LRRHAEITVSLANGGLLQGTVVRLDPDQNILLLRRYNAAADRFTVESVDLSRAAQVRLISRHHQAKYPILGTLVGAALGATVGYTFVHIRWTSDSIYSAHDPIVTVSFGLGGAFMGFIFGAAVAPQVSTERVVWEHQ
jgi:hypothetical protein